MWADILKDDDVRIIEDNSIFIVKAAQERKRYYYRNVWGGSDILTILMFNPGSLDGRDRTIAYIKEVCCAQNFEGFQIINLIPQVAGSIKYLQNADFVPNAINSRLILNVLNGPHSPVLVAWGTLVRHRTNQVFPASIKAALQANGFRLVQLDRGKPNAWYPCHLSYAAGLHGRRGRVEPQDFRMVPFDVKILEKYR